MDSIQDKVFSRIQNWGRGTVFTPKDFLDLASRDATDQALHRLMQDGTVHRIARGLYHFPRTNDRLGIDVPPDLDDVAQALGRQTGSRVAPSGAVAANRLGLSTQVSAQPVYLSDGRTRSVAVGRYIVKLVHVSPKKLPPGDPTSAMVFQALYFLGKDSVDDRVVQTLRKHLSTKQRKTVLSDARYAPVWVAHIARKIATDTEIPVHG
jgi:hypothetical protein